MLKYTKDRLIQHAYTFLSTLLLLNIVTVFADDNDFKTEGIIESKGEDSLVVNAFIFDIDFQTEVKSDKYGDIFFSDLAVGDYVKVEGHARSENRYYASKIEREGKDDDDHDGRELEIKGLISMISTESLEVNGYHFKVTTETRIKGAHGIQVVFEQLKAGMYVEVKGHIRLDGYWVADEIELEERDTDLEIEFYGQINSIVANDIVINHHHIQVTNETLIELRHDQLGDFADLTVGLFVAVKAAINPDGSLLALRIKVKNEHENEIEIIGHIDSVGIDFIETLGYHVDISVYTVLTNHARDTLATADLEKGQRVEIKGSLISKNVIKARRIKVKRFHENEIEFMGQVTFITASQIQVEQTLFNVEENTVILDSQNMPIFLDQIHVGQFVEIKGVLNANDSFYALRIKIEDQGQNEVEISGHIESLSMDAVFISGIQFFVNESTVVLDLQGSSIQFSDLNAGDLVEIKGVLQADGSLHAKRIKLENTPGLIVVSGDITAKAEDQIEVEWPQFQVIQSTILLDANYRQVTLADFSSGKPVTVWAVQSAEGNVIVQAKLNKNNNVTSIAEKHSVLPEVIQLHANYPNPFNPETNISFVINNEGFSNVKLEVYDINGRKVKTLFSGLLDRGNYNFRWNATNAQNEPVSSGMFIYQIKAAGFILSKKMTLIR